LESTSKIHPPAKTVKVFASNLSAKAQDYCEGKRVSFLSTLIKTESEALEHKYRPFIERLALADIKNGYSYFFYKVRQLATCIRKH
jgi:hypothetical protein